LRSHHAIASGRPQWLSPRTTISTAGQRVRIRPMTWRSTSATSAPSGVLPGRRMTATGLPVVAS
jgi:hypothetical protein